MTDLSRLLATMFIWTALTLIIIFTAPNTDAGAMAFILGIAAGLSTIAIWSSSSKENEVTTKHKRRESSRVHRLVDQLDEDEILTL